MSSNASRPSGGGEPVRLQVFLARSGVSSRRAAEELIAEGRVSVNGASVTAPGTKVRPGLDRVEVDGRQVGLAEIVWLALHKPKGYVTSRQDPYGRKTVYELLPEKYHSLFHVGRLDRDSEGLLLMTNDGGGANRMLHPRYGVTKEYLVDVMGSPTSEELHRLTEGVELDDGSVAKAEEVRRLHQVDIGVFRVRVVLREGKKREIRRMMDAIEHPVRRLSRRRFGPIQLGELRSGTFRVLGPQELSVVLDPDRAVEERPADGTAPPRRRRTEVGERAPARVAARPRTTSRGADEAPRNRSGSGEGKRAPVRAERPRRDDGEAPRSRSAPAKGGASRPTRPRRDEGDETPRRTVARPSSGSARGAGEDRDATGEERRPAARKPFTKGRGRAVGRTRDDARRPSRGDAPARPPRGEEGEDAPRRTSARPASGDAPRRTSARPASGDARRGPGQRPTRGDAPARPRRGGDEDAPRRTASRPSADDAPRRTSSRSSSDDAPRRSGGRGPASGEGRPSGGSRSAGGDRPAKRPGGRPGPKPGGRSGGSSGKPPRRGR